MQQTDLPFNVYLHESGFAAQSGSYALLLSVQRGPLYNRVASRGGCAGMYVSEAVRACVCVRAYACVRMYVHVWDCMAYQPVLEAESAASALRSRLPGGEFVHMRLSLCTQQCTRDCVGGRAGVDRFRCSTA